MVQVEEGVGAGEAEEGVVGVERAQGGEGVDGVVGKAAGTGAVEIGDGEAGLGGAGSLALRLVLRLGLSAVLGAGGGDHRQAVGEAGGMDSELEGLAAGGSEEDLVEVEGFGGSPRDRHVAAMGRIEGAAEEGSPWWGLARWKRGGA